MTRLVVGITGATGSIYGIRLLEILRAHADVQTHLVISAPGKRTLVEETAYTVKDVEALATHPRHQRMNPRSRASFSLTLPRSCR